MFAGKIATAFRVAAHCPAHARTFLYHPWSVKSKFLLIRPIMEKHSAGTGILSARAVTGLAGARMALSSSALIFFIRLFLISGFFRKFLGIFYR